MSIQVLNLGLVKAIFDGISPPLNTKAIWFDLGTQTHKVYNATSNTWNEIQSGFVTIIDNLVSSDTTVALSANQGRILNNKIETLGNQFTTISTNVSNAQTDIQTIFEQINAGLNGSFGSSAKTLSITVNKGKVTNVAENDILITTAQVSQFEQTVTGILNAKIGVPNGIPSLDVNQKILSQYLPANFYLRRLPVANESAMLALSDAKIGDIAVRADQNDRLYLLAGEYGNALHWIPLTLNNLITSINGKTGVVILNTDDVREGATNKYFTESRVFETGDTRYVTLNTEQNILEKKRFLKGASFSDKLIFESTDIKRWTLGLNGSNSLQIQSFNAQGGIISTPLSINSAGNAIFEQSVSVKDLEIRAVQDSAEIGDAPLLVIENGLVKRRLSSSLPSRNYVHEQPIASNFWTINHNLQKRVLVTIFTTTGEEVETDTIQVDINTSTATFSEDVAGYAICYPE